LAKCWWSFYLCAEKVVKEIFVRKIEILIKPRNFVQKSKFWSKKSKFCLKIKILVKKSKSRLKMDFFFQKIKFVLNIQMLFQNWNFQYNIFHKFGPQVHTGISWSPLLPISSAIFSNKVLVNNYEILIVFSQVSYFHKFGFVNEIVRNYLLTMQIVFFSNGDLQLSKLIHF